MDLSPETKATGGLRRTGRVGEHWLGPSGLLGKAAAGLPGSLGLEATAENCSEALICWGKENERQLPYPSNKDQVIVFNHQREPGIGN